MPTYRTQSQQNSTEMASCVDDDNAVVRSSDAVTWTSIGLKEEGTLQAVFFLVYVHLLCLTG